MLGRKDNDDVANSVDLFSKRTRHKRSCSSSTNDKKYLKNRFRHKRKNSKYAAPLEGSSVSYKNESSKR